MPRFAQMLKTGMEERGHSVDVWTAKSMFFKFPAPKFFKKWLGYVDQFVVFPLQVKKKLKQSNGNTIFVFTDNALGPWVPLVADLPHAIHCHDFLAQLSERGETPENITGFSGKKYQQFIRRGFVKGKNFIAVSKKTKKDLHRFLINEPQRSHVVYNGLNQSFALQNPANALICFSKKIEINLDNGFILHVGGNLWYKNRLGIIAIYSAWRNISKLNCSLILIGDAPQDDLITAKEKSPFKADIHFLSGVSDQYVQMAYASAKVFLFPSLAEGFGWPIAEAMASGCLVITTNEAPMSEVAGTAGFLINRMPNDTEKSNSWAVESANILEIVATLSPEQRAIEINKGLENVKRFNAKESLDKIEKIYLDILASYKSSN